LTAGPRRKPVLTPRFDGFMTVFDRNAEARSVMAGLVPAIHVFLSRDCKDVNARHKAGHDEQGANAQFY
jgi:hypothetical protein